LNFQNICWVYGDIPEEWRTAIVISIHKKGDRNNPGNYRGISLLNTGYKIYSKIIAKRLTAIAEVLLLIFKKAFESVVRDKLWAIMLSKGIPTHLITIIQKIYMENIIRVNEGKGISEDSRVITQGVREGCPLSNVLFNLYLDKVIRIWLQKLRTSKYFKELIFNTLFFADDQFIISDTEDNLQKAVYLLYNIPKQYNLEIAIKKTKVFSFDGNRSPKSKNYYKR